MQVAPSAEDRIRTGTMGWSFLDWVGPFYPKDAKPADFIGLYAKSFNTVEINSSRYGPPSEKSLRDWARTVPDDFLFSAKVPDSITHEKRLVDAEDEMKHFLAAMRNLGSKLGPMLLQFPPNFSRFEEKALVEFLDKLADWRMENERFAVEFRHVSWRDRTVLKLLSERNIAWVNGDTPHTPRHFEVTADFQYLRLKGRHDAFEKYDRLQQDESETLERWAIGVKGRGRSAKQVFIYAADDYEGFAPGTLGKIRALLDLPPVIPPSAYQQSLF